jgi:hypothetical protein
MLPLAGAEKLADKVGASRKKRRSRHHHKAIIRVTHAPRWSGCRKRIASEVRCTLSEGGHG